VGSRVWQRDLKVVDLKVALERMELGLRRLERWGGRRIVGDCAGLCNEIICGVETAMTKMRNKIRKYRQFSCVYEERTCYIWKAP